MPFEQNSDGVAVNYGIKPKAQGGHTGESGSLHTVELKIKFGDGLPTVAGGNTMLGGHPGGAAHIPSGALLRKATLITITPFAAVGLATLDIGTMSEAGVAIDADGIDVAIAKAAIDAVGEEVACDGALIGTILAQDSFISVNVNVDDYTAGEAILLVEYLAL